jgi:hypothetical protein
VAWPVLPSNSAGLRWRAREGRPGRSVVRSHLPLVHGFHQRRAAAESRLPCSVVCGVTRGSPCASVPTAEVPTPAPASAVLPPDFRARPKNRHLTALPGVSACPCLAFGPSSDLPAFPDPPARFSWPPLREHGSRLPTSAFRRRKPSHSRWKGGSATVSRCRRESGWWALGCVPSKVPRCHNLPGRPAHPHRGRLRTGPPGRRGAGAPGRRGAGAPGVLTHFEPGSGPRRLRSLRTGRRGPSSARGTADLPPGSG